MALTWALCAAPGRRRKPLPCWAPPHPPWSRGLARAPTLRRATRPLAAVAPPLDRQASLSPPQHPRMPLVMAAAAVPHPPVPLA